MKKDKKDQALGNQAHTRKSIKKGMPIKNGMTNTAKNTALQTEGLNQSKTSRDDMLPSDGDNLTNT